MVPILIWYVTMQLFALAALPLAFRICTRLFDRGYGLSKGLGLILITYVSWLLGHTELAETGGAVSFRTVSLSLLLIGLISAVSFFRHLGEIAGFVRARWRLLVAVELVFLVSFGAMLVLRLYVPHISYHNPNAGLTGFVDHAAEKFTDFAVLNSLLTTPVFPPHDAWVAGYQLNYYYFGHLMWACMIKFASVRPEIGFNLALGSVFALTCVLAFSLGYNLTRRIRWAAFTLFMIALSSNLDGFLQLLGLVKAVLIDRLGDGAWYYMQPWYRNYDFWRSSRAVENTITEFPAFSFVLGDLHAHVSSLVILLCGLILAVQIWRSATCEHSLFRYEWLNWDELFLAALLTGAMSAANSWDAITYSLVLAAVLWASRTGRRNPYAYENPAVFYMHRLGGGLASAFLAAIVAGGGILGLFWLFISRFRSPLPEFTFPLPEFIKPLLPGLKFPRPEENAVVAVPADLRTDPFEFFTHWSLLLVPPMLLLLGIFLRVYLPRLRSVSEVQGNDGSGPRQRLIALVLTAVAVACVLVPLWHGWVAILLFLLGVISFLVLLLARLTPVYRLLLGLLFCFSALAWFCEMYFLNDIFEGEIERINTVFKIYYGLWPVAAMLSVLSVRRLVRYARPENRRARAFWVVGAIVLAGAAYPVIAPVQRVSQSSRLGHFRAPQDSRYSAPVPLIFRPETRPRSLTEALDGMRYLLYLHPDDYYAIHWIRQNLPPDAVILEAVGQATSEATSAQILRTAQYTYSGRFSTMTGRPAFGGWLYHSYGWRGESFVAERDRRMRIGEAIYEAESPGEMLNLLRDEGIEYVIVGKHEREQYPNLNEAALSQISELQYVHGQTLIYKVDYDARITEPPPPPLFPSEDDAASTTSLDQLDSQLEARQAFSPREQVTSAVLHGLESDAVSTNIVSRLEDHREAGSISQQLFPDITWLLEQGDSLTTLSDTSPVPANTLRGSQATDVITSRAAMPDNE